MGASGARSVRRSSQSIAFRPQGDGFVVTTSDGEINWFSTGSERRLRAVTHWVEDPGPWLTGTRDGKYRATRDFDVRIPSEAAVGQQPYVRKPDLNPSLLAPCSR